MRENITEEDIQDSIRILDESEKEIKVYKSFKFLEFEQEKRKFYQILMKVKDIAYLSESPIKNAYNNVDNQRFLFDILSISLNNFLTPIYLSAPSELVKIEKENLKIDFFNITDGNAFSIIDGHKRIKYFSQNWVDTEIMVPVILTLNSTGEQDFTMFSLINQTRYQTPYEQDYFLFKDDNQRRPTEKQLLKNRSYILLDMLTRKFPNEYSRLSEKDYKQVEKFIEKVKFRELLRIDWLQETSDNFISSMNQN